MEISQERKIILQTAAGNDIPNVQPSELSRLDEVDGRELDRKYRTSVKPRTYPIPRYNCHGMTFASRRTEISALWAIDKIIEEDGYEEVEPDHVLPGDVIVYYKGDEILHSGIVIALPEKGDYGMPRVCSKWGKWREFSHQANMCPYDCTKLRYYRVTK